MAQEDHRPVWVQEEGEEEGEEEEGQALRMLCRNKMQCRYRMCIALASEARKHTRVNFEYSLAARTSIYLILRDVSIGSGLNEQLNFMNFLTTSRCGHAPFGHMIYAAPT